MIDEIQVRNLALIREATLEPSTGLTVLTGETGAGKTALLSAMKLLMGARASADLVRDGEAGLLVSGRFFGKSFACGDDGVESDDGVKRGEGVESGRKEGGANGEVFGCFEGNEVGGFLGSEVVVTRKVSADGRSRASIDGSMASARELADLVAPSIDLCGQFEHQQLMRPFTHVALLDAWAEDTVAPAREAYKRALAAATEAACELERIREAGDLSSAKLEDARFTLRRFDEVSPAEGEYESLKRDLEIAEHAESLARAASTARAALSEDGGALDSLNTAASALEAAGALDADLAMLAESLREAGFVLEEVSSQVRDYRDGVEFDAETLAAQQERLSQLQGLIRAYGPRMEDVFARRAEAAEVVSLVDDSEQRLRIAERRCAEAEETLAAAADALDAVRAEAAPRFARDVTSVMTRLEMGTAELVCDQERLPRSSWTEAGPSRFEFLYRPTSGTRPRSLVRIASGGEVSRVMLAVKVVLGSHDDVDTLVFDEVDAGVGGSTAVALADVIADLSRTHQVIVVTHLAQVAVRGDTHYVVTRAGDETQLVRVGRSEREREVARMLSGSITDASLAHARELLDRPSADEAAEFAAIASGMPAAEGGEETTLAQIELDITSQVLRPSVSAKRKVVYVDPESDC